MCRWNMIVWVGVLYSECNLILQARNRGGGGVHGVRSHPPQAPKVPILILNIQVKECSRLNWSFKLNSDT